MRIATIPRVVDRSEDSLKCSLRLDIIGRRCCVGANRFVGVEVCVVVVTHNIEDRHTCLVYMHLIAHIVHKCLVISATLRIDNITQSGTIARCALCCGVSLDGRDRLVCKAVTVTTTLIIGCCIILTLRIGKAEECKGALLTTRKLCQGEVVDGILAVVARKEARLTVVICIHLTICRHRVVDIPAILMRSDCILTRTIGLYNAIAVRYCYTCRRSTIRVG